jgi:hypothetical protein
MSQTHIKINSKNRAENEEELSSVEGETSFGALECLNVLKVFK